MRGELPLECAGMKKHRGREKWGMCSTGRDVPAPFYSSTSLAVRWLDDSPIGRWAGSALPWHDAGAAQGGGSQRQEDLLDEVPDLYYHGNNETLNAFDTIDS